MTPIADDWQGWLAGPLRTYKQRKLREGELWWSCLDMPRILRDFVTALEHGTELRDEAAIAWQERAERLEAAARRVIRWHYQHSVAEAMGDMIALRAALADIPTEPTFPESLKS